MSKWALISPACIHLRLCWYFDSWRSNNLLFFIACNCFYFLYSDVSNWRKCLWMTWYFLWSLFLAVNFLLMLKVVDTKSIFKIDHLQEALSFFHVAKWSKLRDSWIWGRNRTSLISLREAKGFECGTTDKHLSWNSSPESCSVILNPSFLISEIKNNKSGSFYFWSWKFPYKCLVK